MTIHKLILYAFLPLILLVNVASADTLDDVARDFAPIDGHILMETQQGVLVDLDAAHRLAVGDLLAVVDPGENVIHPVSGEVLGQLSQVRGYIEVTRIAQGFSYAQVVTAGMKVKRSDRVRRFEQVPAYFRGTPDSLAKLQTLKMKLPHLSWVEQTGTTADKALVFVAEGQQLTVKTEQGAELHNYALAPSAQAALPTAPLATPTITAPKQEVYPDNVLSRPSRGGIIAIKKRRHSREYWRSQMIPGSVVGLEIGPLGATGEQQVAVALKTELVLYSVDGERLVEQSRTRYPRGVVALRVDGADLNNDGRWELYVTAKSEENVASFVMVPSQKGYVVGAKSLRWFFRAESTPQGRTLVGQRFGGQSRTFEGPVFQMALNGSKVVAGARVSRPVRGHVLSYSQIHDGVTVMLAGEIDDRMTLSQASGQEIWRSDEEYGGSEAYLLKKGGGATGISEESYEHEYLPARVLQAPKGEVLVPVNIGARLGRIRSFNSSHLRALTVEQGQLVEVWRTKKQQGYLPDYRIADLNGDGIQDLVLAVLFQHDNIASDGRFALISYQLPETEQ